MILFKENDVFLTNEDKDRLKMIEIYNKVYNNKTYEAFIKKYEYLSRKKLIKAHTDEEIRDIYMQIPLAKEIVKIFTDLLFRYDINIQCKDILSKEQELVIDIQKYNKLHLKLIESSVNMLVDGGIVAKTYLYNNKSMIKFYTASEYFVFKNQFNEVKKQCLSRLFKLNNELDTYRYIETHYYSEETETWHIAYQVFKELNGVLIEEIDIKTIFEDLEKDEDTLLDNCSLVYIPFDKGLNDDYGRSIFTGLLQLLDEFNSRISTMSKLLDKYSYPSFQGPEDLIDDLEELEDSNSTITGELAYIFNKVKKTMGWGLSEKYIARDKDSAKVEVIEIDGKMEQHIAYLKELKELFYITTNISPSLYALDSSATVSGRALKLKSFRTDCAVDKCSNYYKDAIATIMYNCLKYQEIYVDSFIKAEYPTINIIKGFSRDDYEDAQLEQIRITSGNTSIVDSISRLDRCSVETSQQKLREIKEEQKIELNEDDISIFKD